uniref:Cytochrome b n=1 Tax=Cecidomyiidae sp. 3 LC-2017 TaxID=2030135 RepID=A0A343LA52_9DIPT|nr:cytochrome b [Cecidomyiidae sp. 3 LC-2017]
MMKTMNLQNLVKNFLLDVKIPKNISLFWNFGSILGVCISIQLMSGLFLAFRYSPETSSAFFSVNSIIMNETWNGFQLRNIHANTASFFFMGLFIHTGRSLYYKSFLMKETWLIGVTMLMLIMGIAFMGYVLPWGQMSFWGSTVITNLLSSIPYLGNYLVQWIWGGFSVDNPTLTRFYCIHFILPFFTFMFMFIHLIYLHHNQSNNPLGIKLISINKIKFNVFFTIKDFLGFIVMFIFLVMVVNFYPHILGDSDNFILANPLITPEHIQPEWYFLFAYSILRAIPSKLGGVIALLMSILILYFIPFFNMSKMKSKSYYPLSKILYWTFILIFLLLTWVGMQPVELPFTILGQFLSFFYFMFYLFSPVFEFISDKLLI